MASIAAFLQALPKPVHAPVRFFHHDGDYYTVHGADADAVAVSMGRATDVRTNGGVRTLNLNPALFAECVSSLLVQRGACVELYAYATAGGGAMGWTLSRSGSPCDVAMFQAELERAGCGGDGDVGVGAASVAAVVLQRHEETQAGRVCVGVCVLNTTLKEMSVYAFEDEAGDLHELECVLVEHQVREAVVGGEEEGPGGCPTWSMSKHRSCVGGGGRRGGCGNIETPSNASSFAHTLVAHRGRPCCRARARTTARSSITMRTSGCTRGSALTRATCAARASRRAAP